MSTKGKQTKPKVKKPKPNLYGPNSPSRKKKVTANQQNEDDEPIGSFYIKNDDSTSES